MSKQAMLLALCALPAVPTAHADIDLMGKRLQIYGELHGSVDYYDRGAPTAVVPEPKGAEITSNSSYIGFKGEAELADGVQGVWKFESEFDLSGETGTLDSRNRYFGISTVAGNILLGTHNTPFKEIGSRYTLFGDTIGDRTGILGQTSGSDNQFNQRASSMVLYQIHKAGFSGSLLYSHDFAATSDPDQGNTGISNTLSSFGLGYKNGNFDIAAAYEKQVAIDNVQGRNASGTRIGINYRIGDFQIGGIVEALKDDGYGASIERNAWVANIAYRITGFTIAGQYMKAGESALAIGNDGARQLTIGLYYDLGKNAQLYLVYAALENDTNAFYHLARSGHGQAFAPTQAGEKVTATSAGAIYNF